MTLTHLGALGLLCVAAQCAFGQLQDSFSDTWVATDALGRKVPTFPEVPAPRADRTVGIFYFLWHGAHVQGGPFDVTKILAADPDAMQKPDSPLWGPLHVPHHWGESLFGYYLTDDEGVLRKHAQMLSDAGVDVVIFDVTNQITYRDYYRALLRVWSEMRRLGNRTPQVAFLTPFWDPAKVTRELWRDLYSPGPPSRPLVSVGRQTADPRRSGTHLRARGKRAPEHARRTAARPHPRSILHHGTRHSRRQRAFPDLEHARQRGDPDPAARRPGRRTHRRRALSRSRRQRLVAVETRSSRCRPALTIWKRPSRTGGSAGGVTARTSLPAARRSRMAARSPGDRTLRLAIRRRRHAANPRVLHVPQTAAGLFPRPDQAGHVELARSLSAACLHQFGRAEGADVRRRRRKTPSTAGSAR